MKKQTEIAKKVMAIQYLWKRLVFAAQMASGLDKETVVNGRILGYLEMNADKDIFQKDIERETSLTKSAVSNILSMMERKGYIRRDNVSYDARLKKITLTPHGREVHDQLVREIDRCDANFVKDISSEEQEALLSTLSKICRNMKEMEEEFKHD